LPTVLGFRGNLQGLWHLVHVWQAWPKTCRICVYGHFCELLPTVLGLRSDLQGPWHLSMFERYDQKLVVFTFSGRFVSYCAQFWVFGVIFKVHDT
jgi:hypothetical protein